MKEELAIRAAKLFLDLFPDAWKHEKGEWVGWHVGCPKCSVIIKHNTEPNSTRGRLVSTKESKKPCTVPTPIDINWDNAIKLRDVTPKRYFDYKLLEVVQARMQDSTLTFTDAYYHATPADYIEAACVAKEAENEAM